VRDIHAYFARLAVNRASIDDLVQETFITAWQNLPALRDERKLRSWLYGIAYRHYLKHRDRLASSAWEVIGDEPAAASADPGSDDSLTAHMVREALLALPDRYLHPLLLLYWEDLSYQEAAAVLSVPIGTLAWRAHKALKLMRAALAEKGSTDEAIPHAAQRDRTAGSLGED